MFNAVFTLLRQRFEEPTIVATLDSVDAQKTIPFLHLGFAVRDGQLSEEEARSVERYLATDFLQDLDVYWSGRGLAELEGRFLARWQHLADMAAESLAADEPDPATTHAC